MKLAEQWSEVVAALPRGWQSASVALELDDPAHRDRAAAILGPAAPARAHSALRVDFARDGQPVLPSPELVRRVLARLDGEGIRGRLTLVGAPGAEATGDSGLRVSPSLAAQWSALVDALPADWSHLLADVELDSSDFIDRAALLMAPSNPSLVAGTRTLRFRCARTVGYGVAFEMARRCLERLDRDGITGRVRVVRVVSDARPVYTQGPVWYLGGRPV